MKEVNRSQKIIIFVVAGLLVLAVGGYLVYSATIGKVEEVTNDLTGESVVDTANDLYDGDSTQSETVIWPSAILGEFPEYTDGDLIQVPDLGRNFSPYLVYVDNTSESAVIAYVEKLKTQGFIVEEEGIAYGDEDTAWMLGKEDASGTYGVLLALTYGSGSNDDDLVITYNK